MYFCKHYNTIILKVEHLIYYLINQIWSRKLKKHGIKYMNIQHKFSNPSQLIIVRPPIFIGVQRLSIPQ